MRRRRWWVLAAGGLGGLVGVALLGAGASWLWLRTPAGSAWLAPRIAQAITPVGGEAALGHLHTNGWNRVTLTDVHLVMRPELGGEQVIHVGRLQTRLEPLALLRGRVVLHDTSLEGVFIDMTPSETVSTEPFVGLGVELDAASVDVRSLTVVYRNPDGEPLVRVVGAHGTGRVHAIGDAIHLGELDLGGWLAPLGGTTARLTGDAVYDNDGIHLDSVAVRLPSSQLSVDGLAGLNLDLDLDLSHLDGRDANALLGDVGLHGALTGTAHLGGTSSGLTYAVDLNGAEDTRGSVQGSGEVDLTGERIRWTSDLNLNQLAVHDLVPEQVDTVTMSGRLVLEGTGTQYPDDLDLTGAWTGRGDDIYGNVLEDVELNFTVSEGLVRLTDTRFDGILGELTVSGEVHAVDGPMDLVVEGMLSPARLRELGVDSVDAPGWVRARLTGDALNSDAPLNVSGTVRFAPFRSGPDIVADELTAAFQATQRGERTEGEATWSASGLTAYGVEMAAVEGESTPFASGPEGFEASGLAHAKALVMPDTFTVARADVTWSTSNIRGDRTEAQLSIGSHELLTFPGTDGTLRAELLGDDLRLSVRLNDGPRTLLHTTGTSNLDSGTYALDTLTLGLTPRATWEAKRPVRFTLGEHGLEDADIALSGNLGSATLTGTVGTRGHLDATLRLTGFSLDTLAELDPESAGGLAGTLDLDLALSERASNPTARALWKVDGLWVEDTTRWLDAEGRFDVADGQLTTTVRLAVAGALLAHMQGSVPLNSDLADPGLALDEPMDLSVAIVGGPLKRLSQAFPAAEGLPEGDGGGALTLSGPVRDPHVRLAGITSVGVPGWPNRARVEFELVRNGPGLSGWVDVRDGYEARMHVAGFGHTDVGTVIAHVHEHGGLPDEVPLDTWASRLGIQGTFIDFPARSLTAAADLPIDVSGVLVGGFGVRGSLEAPELDTSIQWIRGALGRQPMPLANLDLASGDKGYDLSAAMDFGERKLTVRGSLPIEPHLSEPFEAWSTGEMSLIVEGQVPLQALTAVNSKLTGIEGDLTLKGGIRGAPHDPEPALVATVDQGTMAYHPLGLRAQSIDLRLVAHPQEIRLDRFRVQTAPSRRRTLASSLDDISEGPPSLFEAQGRATLDHGEVDQVAGTVNLSGGTWVMNTSETVLRMDGALDIAGQWPALQVGGQLALHSGNILLDAAAFLDRAPLKPDSRIRLIREGVVSTRPAEAEAPWYESIEANVDLRLGRSLELAVGMPFVDDLGALGAAVSRADLTARLGGQVSLSLSNSQPTMIGEVDLAEGTLRMLRSRFSLDSGTLLFTGNDYSEPNMDIRATMTVADAEINTHVTGTPSRPRFESQSDQYPDQSTILMIMLTGRSPDENSNASTEAMPQALAGLVLDSLLGAQNLGNVSLSSDGTVRVGAPISPSLYATVVASPSSDIVDNHFSGEVEWNIAPKVVLASSVGDVTSWLDLYWEIRF